MTNSALLGFLQSNARWLTAGATLTFLSSFGQTFFISVFAGEIRAEFDLSHGEWGGLYSIGTIASAAVMIWAGMLTDTIRVRYLGPIVLLGLSFACLSMALNPWVGLLPAVIFLLRFFGQGMCSHLAMVAMARWFTSTRGRALSIATLGYAAGEAILPLIFVSAMAMVDWQNLWIVSAVICLFGVPVLYRLLQNERTPQHLAKTSSSTGMDQRHWTRRQALRHSLFWVMTPAVLGPSAFVTALFFHQVHLADVKGWSHIELVALFPVYTGVGIISMLGFGWALDKWGTGRLTPFYQIPMAVGFLCFASGDSTLMAVLGFTFIAITSGANATVLPAFWAEFYGTAHIGAIKALATAVMVLGSAIGPAITGGLIDLGIGLETQFVWIAVYFMLICAVLYVGVNRAMKLL